MLELLALRDALVGMGRIRSISDRFHIDATSWPELPTSPFAGTSEVSVCRSFGCLCLTESLFGGVSVWRSLCLAESLFDGVSVWRDFGSSRLARYLNVPLAGTYEVPPFLFPFRHSEAKMFC